MADLPKPREANNPAPGMDPLRSLIREQQAALDGLESSRRELESVVEHLLASRIKSGNGSQPAPGAGVQSLLSKRELEVLKLMVEGRTSREIGVALGISFKTAVTHRSSIMSKMDVHETASVVREAIRRGLV
jgi:DNA-binding NarL/FixJ family response regulator